VLFIRYIANGTLDTTFGNGGIVTTAVPFGVSPSSAYRGVAVYPNAGTANDGKIIAVGGASSTTSGGQNEIEYTAVRYNPDGSLDSTFGGGAGYEVIPDPQYTYPNEIANAVAIESDGKPIVVGYAHTPPNPANYSRVVRLNVDGSLDATFGNGGFVDTAIGTTSTGSTYSQFSAVAIQPDGKIDAVGMAQFGTQNDFMLARYLPSEPEVGSFTASPNPVTAGSSVALTASNISDGNAGSSVTQVAFYEQVNGSNTLLGYGTQTSPGVWTFTWSTAGLTAGTYTLYAQAKDSYGVLGDPDAIALTVQ
jgi:uncharacterized delta-60 repeat protein